MNLVPTISDKVASNILSLNERIVNSVNQNIVQLDKILNNTVDENKAILTKEQIISDANGKLDNEIEFINALKAAINIAVSGSYSV